jgi:hypothetical protein
LRHVQPQEGVVALEQGRNLLDGVLDHAIVRDEADGDPT